MKERIFRTFGRVNCTGYNGLRKQHFIQFKIFNHHYDWYLTFPKSK